MSAVKSRNRKDVHERKSHREECRYVPECDPVPFFREDGAYRSETAYAVGSLFGEDHFHRLGIRGELVGSHLDSAGNRLENVVADLFGLEECRRVDFESYSHLGVFRQLYLFHNCVGRFSCAAQNREIHSLVVMTGKCSEKLVERRCLHFSYGDDFVTRFYPRFGSSFTRHHLSDASGEAVCEEVDRSSVAFSLFVEREDEFLRNGDAYRVFAVAEHSHLLCLNHLYACLYRIFQFFAVGCQRYVSVMETYFSCLAGIGESHFCLLHRNIFLAGGINESGVNQDCEQEIEQHPCYHYKESLPCRF